MKLAGCVHPRYQVNTIWEDSTRTAVESLIITAVSFLALGYLSALAATAPLPLANETGIGAGYLSFQESATSPGANQLSPLPPSFRAIELPTD